MIGLFWKDILVMRKTLKYYLLVLAVYAVLALLEILNYAFIITFIQMLIATTPFSAFAYDEQAKWDRYAAALPLGRKAVVGARYLFVLIVFLAAFTAGAVGCAGLWLARAEDPLELALTLLVSTSIGATLTVILLPICYKLGPEKARTFLYILVFVPMIAIILLVRTNASMLEVSVAFLDTLSPSKLVGMVALLPLGSLAAMLVSYLISCRIAAGKEY